MLTVSGYKRLAMSSGYLLASVLIGWLTYHYLGFFVPGWVAGLAGFMLACPAVFIGMVRKELPRAGKREDWLKNGAVERRFSSRD